VSPKPSFSHVGFVNWAFFLVRRVEQTPTASGDTPTSPCVITACGQLQPDDPSLAIPDNTSGDKYEDFPEDEQRVEVSKPDVALQVDRGHFLWP